MEINSDITLYASWARDRRPATPTTEEDSGSSTYAAIENLPNLPSVDTQNPLMYTIGSIPYYYMHAEIDRDPS
jgi:hypothetical protein